MNNAINTVTAFAFTLIMRAVERYNAAAQNLYGHPAVVLVEMERRFETIEAVDSEGTPYETTEEMVEYAIASVPTKGYKLVGRLDYASGAEGKPLRFAYFGSEPFSDLGYVPCTRCDACGVSRRRNDLYVLSNGDGETIVVGGNCLDQYVRGGVEGAIALSLEARKLSAELNEERVSTAHEWPLKGVLEAAAASVRTDGWHRSGSDYSTRDRVFAAIAKGAKVLACDSQKADKVRDWLLSLDPQNDYEHNLASIAKSGLVTRSSLGTAVSAIVAYDRAMESATSAGSKHVGAVGDKYHGTLVVSGVRYFEGYYGTTTFLTFADEAGNVLIWKTGSDPDVERGDRVIVKGRIKAHDEYRGVNQTVLTRCRITSAS